MKRLALRVLIASVALSALLGCLALLAGEFGETQAKVLLTSLTVSGTSILAMACAPALEGGGMRPLPQLGIGLAVVTALFLFVAIWGTVEAREFSKTVGTLSVLSVGAAHASLVSLAPLGPQRRWVYRATLLLGAALSVGLIVCIWYEVEGSAVWRTLGVVSILLGAGTILVPVLHRMERGSTEDEDAPARTPTARPPRVRYCVACGSPRLLAGEGEVRSCLACGAHFRASIDADAATRPD